MPTGCRARRRSTRSSAAPSCRHPTTCRRSCFERPIMDLMLIGRVAVITGPAKGMGAAITLAFAAEGARLALVGRDTAAIEPVAEEARAKGGEAIVVRCDLTDPAQCEHAAEAAKRAYGRIDILVNV